MRTFQRFLVVCLLGAVGVAPVLAAEPKLETDDQKTVYALGYMMSRNIQSYALSKEELAILQAGLAAGVLGEKPQIEVEQFTSKVQELGRARMKVASEAEQKASEEFLAKAAAEKGAVKTDSGLIYVEVKPGTGDSPKATDTVKVHYHGTLRDGSVFDSSVQRGTPATFPLNRVIPCWTEGVQKMKVGGKAKLICPAKIAYGDHGAPPKIKGGAALSFDVELLEIVPPAAPPVKPAAPAAKPAPAEK